MGNGDQKPATRQQLVATIKSCEQNAARYEEWGKPVSAANAMRRAAAARQRLAELEIGK